MNDNNKLKGIKKTDEHHWIRKINAQKGKKAFKSVEHPMIKSKLVKLTEWQYGLIHSYCTAKGITFSDMVRISFAKMIKEEGYMEQLSEADKRQLELFK
jgi:hypothetical protein